MHVWLKQFIQRELITIKKLFWNHLNSICRKVAPFLDKIQEYLSFRKGCIFLDPHLFGIMGREPKFPRHCFSDYTHQLYFDALISKPKLIVELGTDYGVSTRVLLAAAENIGATLLSIDIKDCSGIDINEKYKKKWYFEQCDDVYFAQHKFDHWKSNQGIEGKIDFLFIDTSHLYDHTVQEIHVWFPKLSDHATVIFHDTNVRTFYRRHDSSFGIGWNNNRGVIRAIEEYLKTSLDEKVDFVGCVQGWAIKHNPLCVGYTIMKRI
ncbi:class I SAM-dependent methyltransferase [candidate division CSSED10-310 bacterium]|uniref:Class I SAM-dependent methyltransferase n=1 Tax=candidate division CSSED10-310 bacterium TaxID=2855610 RepID=A0ABV6YQX2_UNCC1